MWWASILTFQQNKKVKIPDLDEKRTHALEPELIFTLRTSPRNSQHTKLTDSPFHLNFPVAFWRVDMGVVSGFGRFFLAFGKFGEMLVESHQCLFISSKQQLNFL